MKNLKKLLFDMFQNEKSKAYMVVSDIIAIIILFSVMIVSLETVPSFWERYNKIFLTIEMIITIIFTLEYLARVYSTPIKKKYVLSFMGLTDLLGTLPGYFIFFNIFPDLIVLRTLRMLRVLRLLRFLRILYFSRRGLKERRPIIRKIDILTMEIYFFTLLVVVMISASLLYLFEKNVPESKIKSIPDGMWFAIATISTVGYGDIVSVTPVGKTIASITMIVGLIIFALLFYVVGRIVQYAIFGSELEMENTIKLKKYKKFKKG
jgi:voltage-gated potassium channel